MKNRKAFIVGLKTTKLLNREIKFLKKYKPWGVILFSRNIKNIDQCKILTESIRKIFNDKKYPILIDEEGGRVSRLGNIINTSMFSAEYFGNLYKQNYKNFNLYYKIYIKQISYLLNSIGVNINTVPMLDVRRDNSSKIIGNRSFGKNSRIVSKIGNFSIEHFHKHGILTMIKHIPGHGLAKVDSHKLTPIVENKLKQLNKIDFFPFKNKKSLLAMTAHILYKNLDRKYPATLSRKIIKLIRNTIKFKGILVTDDISMKGLKYTLSENIKKALEAGCNLILHCNANYKEMLIVAKNSPKVNGFIIKKTSQLYKFLS